MLACNEPGEVFTRRSWASLPCPARAFSADLHAPKNIGPDTSHVRTCTGKCAMDAMEGAAAGTNLRCVALRRAGVRGAQLDVVAADTTPVVQAMGCVQGWQVRAGWRAIAAPGCILHRCTTTAWEPPTSGMPATHYHGPLPPELKLGMRTATMHTGTPKCRCAPSCLQPAAGWSGQACAPGATAGWCQVRRCH